MATKKVFPSYLALVCSVNSLTQDLPLKLLLIWKQINGSLHRHHCYAPLQSDSLFTIYKRNIKTKFFENYINFVDTLLSKQVNHIDRMERMYVIFVDSRKKHNTYFKKFIVSIVNILSLFSYFLFFKYLNESYLFFRANIQNSKPRC